MSDGSPISGGYTTSIIFIDESGITHENIRTVDTAKVGTYIITYKVTNENYTGNDLTRKVIIK